MTEKAPRRTEYVRLDHLTPDPANPKAHAMGTIDNSISRFGLIDQIVRDDRTGHIISGHGRHDTLTTMRDRGDSPPEGIRVDADGHWLVPVVVGWASRTDAEAHAALIALNRTTELGGWVDDSLISLLDELSDGGNDEAGLHGVGFDLDELEDLRGRLLELGDEGIEPPDVPGTLGGSGAGSEPLNVDHLMESVLDGFACIGLELPPDHLALVGRRLGLTDEQVQTFLDRLATETAEKPALLDG
jgi:hypothetical protein